jgi:hypothetical protein
MGKLVFLGAGATGNLDSFGSVMADNPFDANASEELLEDEVNPECSGIGRIVVRGRAVIGTLRRGISETDGELKDVETGLHAFVLWSPLMVL